MALHCGTRAYPLVVVLGATGCGKSKLALEIAHKFNGEIISADSMQIYKGLDIVTNKVTKEEQALVKHHLLDFVDPATSFTVHNFKSLVLPLIDELTSSGKLPVIVGGTHYYLEAILWNFLLHSNKETSSGESEASNSESEESPVEEHELRSIQDVMACRITQKSLRHIPGPVLHEFLKQVDQERADTLHPNDRRKIIRSLQVYQQTGLPFSQLIAEQHKFSNGPSVSGPLSFPNAHMFWVQCEQDVLNERLNQRVDEMISRGLIEELVDFHGVYNKQRLESDQSGNYTQGIFQSIGFKEFHPYLILPEERKHSAEGQTILQECINSMKTVTSQYSKKQIKWIRGRFLRESNRPVPPIYGFDATDVDQWNSQVRDPAFQIVESILKGETTDVNRVQHIDSSEHSNKTFLCDICSRTIVGTLQWQIHLKSRRHYKMKKRKNVPAQERVI